MPDAEFHENTFSDSYLNLLSSPNVSCIENKLEEKLKGNTHPNDRSLPNAFIAAINSQQFKHSEWTSLDKAKSPRIQCFFKNEPFLAIIDSGAEVNVLDLDFARALNIGIINTEETALAANKLPLQVMGQSKDPVEIMCQTNNGRTKIYLGVVLIINNLGAKCLIGEPGKQRNSIVCLPKQKLVLMSDLDGIAYTPYASVESLYKLIRADINLTLSPGDSYAYTLPEAFSNQGNIAITPRSDTAYWLKPSIVEPSSNRIYLINSSPSNVFIQRSDHLADIRSTQVYEAKSPKALLCNQDDSFQYKDFAKSRTPDFSQLDSIQVDPDKVLTPDERQIFHKLHQRFAKLFTKQPGRYNGQFGFIENRLQFSAPPPPNSRTHIPNYTPSMNAIMAEKMDQLESWGVLLEPEKAGVQVEFVSPSMLVPKPDKGEFRLVTDFSALNGYLKRVPNTSSTIAQTKARIAKARYVIHMDLSNYFYQCGMQQSDICYLGTVHPYKGLRVYTCDPQGLKGASERSYEKLVRIYGDMVQDGRLAQMADGLHVLGQSVHELASNYVEVLNRAETCHLTFKPSKTIICPLNITLFGWDLRGYKWYPTKHTISSLCNAKKPITVKQLRSFLGSFKQLSASLPNYATTIHELEQVVGGRKSSERIVWTETLDSSFTRAKQLAANPHGIAEPRPEDQLSTYSDYSAEHRAVGGRLVIHRLREDGTYEELLGGFFNVVLDKHKKNMATL